jgi:hypothetical protein
MGVMGRAPASSLSSKGKGESQNTGYTSCDQETILKDILNTFYSRTEQKIIYCQHSLGLFIFLKSEKIPDFKLSIQ